MGWSTHGIGSKALQGLLELLLAECVHLLRGKVVIARHLSPILAFLRFPRRSIYLVLPAMEAFERIIAVLAREIRKVKGLLTLQLIKAGRARILEAPIRSIMAEGDLDALIHDGQRRKIDVKGDGKLGGKVGAERDL